MKRIYVAGFFDSRARLRPHVETLRSLGHTILSTWHDVAEGFSMEKPEARWDVIAVRDLDQITFATLLLLDTIDITPRGGREVEFGYALRMGIWCIVIGPRRNVFHHLVNQYDTWEQFFAEGGIQ